MSDREGLADDYLNLLKGALAHTLYAEVDSGINYRRNVLGARAVRAAAPAAHHSGQDRS